MGMSLYLLLEKIEKGTRKVEAPYLSPLHREMDLHIVFYSDHANITSTLHPLVKSLRGPSNASH